MNPSHPHGNPNPHGMECNENFCQAAAQLQKAMEIVVLSLTQGRLVDTPAEYEARLRADYAAFCAARDRFMEALRERRHMAVWAAAYGQSAES